MLDVQKAALTNRMRQRLVAIRERELDYYTSNCRLLGNQAALVAGFAYSGKPPRCISTSSSKPHVAQQVAPRLAALHGTYPARPRPRFPFSI